jgi:hypothetical protein
MLPTDIVGAVTIPQRRLCEKEGITLSTLTKLLKEGRIEAEASPLLIADDRADTARCIRSRFSRH